MDLRYGLLAEHINLDHESLTVCAASVLDDAVIKTEGGRVLEPGQIIGLPCTFLTVWSKEDLPSESFTFRVEGPESSGREQEVQVSFGENLRFLHRIRLQGIQFTGNGDYSFVVSFFSRGVKVERTAWVLKVQVVP